MSSLGIDYGSRRVGIAISYSDELATPHSVLKNEGDLDDLADRIVRLADELEVERMILGVPKQKYRCAAV